MLRLIPILLASLPLVAPAQDDDWQDILQQIKREVTIAVTRSDNYICVQNLSRFYYTSLSTDKACRQPPVLPDAPLLVQDRLKLDVAVSQGNEIYSWHGEHNFSAASVNELVRQGPISSGTFNGYLRNIFGEPGVTFTFRGKTTVKDVELYQFEYDVPLAASHYTVGAVKGFDTIPFHGSFTADTETFNLYSLTVTAYGDKIVKSNVCAAETTVTYQQVPIADHESMLPASFDLRIGARPGTFTESQGSYAQCREYRGESTLKFDVDDTAANAAEAPQVQPEQLAAGLYLHVILKSEIDEDQAFAGQPIEAVLQNDVKLKKGEKLARGAILRGTVTGFQIFHQPSHMVSLKLEFNSITDGNKIYLCNTMHHFPPGSAPPTYVPGRGGRFGSSGTIGMHAPTEPEDGTQQFQVSHLHLGKNYATEFITTNPAAPAP